MAKILIIANASNRARVFLPIANALLEMGTKVTALSLDRILGGEASQVLQKSRIPFLEFPYLGDKKLFDMTKPERFKALRRSRRPVHEILKSVQPDVILLGAASYVEAVIIEEARSLKIKTALMQDGLRVYEKKGSFQSLRNWLIEKVTALVNEWAIALYGVPYYFSPFETNRVDRILLFGSGILDQIARRGIYREKLVVTGNPLYDSTTPLLSTRAAEMKMFIGIPDAQKVALFGMQCFHKHGVMKLDDESGLVRELINIFCEFPNFDLIIKLHPDNDYEYYRNLFSNWNPPSHVHLLKDEFTPQELLGIADVFITVYSTMALEALVNRVPVITIGFSRAGFELKLGPAALHVNTPDELKILLREWDEKTPIKLQSEAVKVLDRELAHLGFASEKAAEALLELE